MTSEESKSADIPHLLGNRVRITCGDTWFAFPLLPVTRRRPWVGRVPARSGHRHNYFITPSGRALGVHGTDVEDSWKNADDRRYRDLADVPGDSCHNQSVRRDIWNGRLASGCRSRDTSRPAYLRIHSSQYSRQQLTLCRRLAAKQVHLGCFLDRRLLLRLGQLRLPLRRQLRLFQVCQHFLRTSDDFLWQAG